MRYLLLVGHGKLPSGFHSVLNMLVGDRKDIISCNMEDRMGIDTFIEQLKQRIEPIGADDSLFVFGDIVGGSPLTNTLITLSDRGLLSKAYVFGGMNLTMVITAVLETDVDDDTLAKEIVDESRAAIRRVETD